MWRVNFFKPTFFDNCFFFVVVLFQKGTLFSQFMDDFYTQIS